MTRIIILRELFIRYFKCSKDVFVMCWKVLFKICRGNVLLSGASHLHYVRGSQVTQKSQLPERSNFLTLQYMYKNYFVSYQVCQSSREMWILWHLWGEVLSKKKDNMSVDSYGFLLLSNILQIVTEWQQQFTIFFQNMVGIAIFQQLWRIWM